jgi:hypothetical protein
MPISALNTLADHPFTVMGLSDREKFHTGMLAHTIKYFWAHSDQNKRWNLLEELLGQGMAYEAFNEKRSLEIDIEKESVDLLVTLAGERTPMLFAEVKFKTTLHSEQLKKYKRKHSTACGIVLGLFQETDQNQCDGFASICFPEKLVNLFNKHPDLLEGAAGKNDDELALIRLWVSYLESIHHVQKLFDETGLNAIPNAVEVGRGLQRIKLKGIFERHRYHLIQRALNVRREDGEEAEIFNTHGNAGIHISLKLNDRYSYGLQWQGGLKLFIVDEQFSIISPSRDDALELLANEYHKAFPNGLNMKLNKTGKFRSVTVEDWDIFNDATGKADAINQRLAELRNLRSTIVTIL